MPSLKSPKPPINGRKPSEPSAPPPPELYSGEIQRLLEDISRHWAKTLPDRVVIHDLLLSRGVTGRAVQELGIGYSDGKLTSVLPSDNTDEGRSIRGLLFACGVLDGHGRERFAGCVVFPVRDKDNVIVNVYGITPDAAREVFLPYPCPLYHVRALIAQDVTVTRSIFEFLALYGKGQRNVVFAHAGWSGEEIEEMTGPQELPQPTPPEPKPEAGTSAAAEPQIQTYKDRVTFTFADRVYEVDSLSRNRAPGSLSVTIHGKKGDLLFSDKIEMYAAKDRDRFIRSCARGLEVDEDVVKGDLSRMHVRLRELQDSLILEAEKPKSEREVPPMSESDRRAALEFLMAPRLTDVILRHFKESGIAGEEANLLAGYIAATSRLLSKPLHVLFQASSASGKTTLMKAVVSMMPPEEVFSYSGISPKAVQYMQGRDLRHSLFVMEEDKGIEFAREIIKLLKTEGKATIATTIKDPQTGQMRTFDFTVEGPMGFFTTSTALSIDDEQYNRDIVCSADESREQTARIFEVQRLLSTLEGKEVLDRRAEVRRLHQNAQRLLRPLTVINPYALHMTFADSAHRLRRDHEKYLGIIEAVTLLHQYQRPVKTRRKPDGTDEQYIEVTLEDIGTANRTALAVLGRSLDDCPPHTRTFMEQAAALSDEAAEKNGVDRNDVRFTARELADRTGLSISQVQRHLFKLIELEYVCAHAAHRSRFRQYEILYRKTGEETGKFLPGILDVRELKRRAAGGAHPHKEEVHPHG